jgi:ABC-type uncharacterized transport system substrate-binding protein
MRELGYVEGQSIVIESRFADGKPERIQVLVRERLALAPDVIVAAGSQPVRAFKQATASVPIVMAIVSDPVDEGLVGSLARSGGNLTGQAFENQALTTKRRELFNRQTVVDSAARRRLPATYESKDFVKAGGLMSYGPSFPDMHRRAAIYVDRILKGAKPADLPIEQPTKFELVINLKTAKVLGLTIPPSLLGRADEVIQ